ncbi:M48 family metalloprotease [Halioxenophilus sp. WMMB6]|uniref:M48 family metalloprotease n=1 Tax=Halioxenophilus sp. WMMB6 TaxID=3073815 RepID=UPI00295E5C91|nr:M48 family metalloprotease [Halioxenophilus sp. WMMB6]
MFYIPTSQVTKQTIKRCTRLLPACLLLGSLASLPLSSLGNSNNIQLPDLGDTSSGLISPAREYKLGQAWLRMFRSQVKTSSDPLLYEYTEQLLADLATHSQLKNQQLDLIIIPNPTINAFAVPGGVVGVNTGLFLYAEDEDQMASVLSHELAHLSQRHYARSLEASSNASIPTMAGILAGFILAATAGADAGMAAISATQAAALDQQLRFSRQNEQEADRIGLQTLIAAGRNPSAPAEMFERMLRETRYSSRPPEFLLTHPVTESRIADARNRANRLAEAPPAEHNYFYFMQARAKLLHAENANIAVQIFTSELEGESPNDMASRYGLALALTEAGRFDEAKAQLAYLTEMAPEENLFTIATAKLEAKMGDYDAAQYRLQQALKLSPDNHPLNTALAEVLMDAGRYSQSELVLTEHTKRRPNDEYLWYLLAEVRGLSGNILGLHQARAEYFILNGVYDKARKQIDNALKLAKSDYTIALLEQRKRDIDEMMDENDF